MGINDLADNFDKLNANGELSGNFDKFINDARNLKNAGITKYFEELAKQGENARASISDLYAVVLNGKTKGFANVSNIIKTFNSLDPKNQKDFAKAVQMSNVQLGDYLENLQGSNASMRGYSRQLVGATLKTVGLTIKTAALNAAITMGLSLAIQGIIDLVSSWIKAEENAREAAVESIKTYEEKIDTFDDLIDKYKEIVDSQEDEAEKTKQLETFKTDLIEIYGLEKDAVDNLNLSRANGIELLKQEIAESKKIARQEWLEKNGDAITTAKNKTNNARRYNDTFNTFLNIDNGDGRNSIRKSIIDLFDDYITVNGELESTISFEINTDNIYEEYEKIKSIMRTMDTIRSKAESAGSGLTDTEEAIYLNLQAHLNSIQTLIDDGTKSIYDTAYKYEALNKLDEYINDGHSLENVGKKNYESWRNGLIEQAQGDKELEKALVKVVADTLPALEKSFQNLQSLYDKYLGKSFLNGEAGKQADKGIKQFLDSLSDEDLEIATKIPDLFAQGLTGATKKIQEWKNNPANHIDAEDVFNLEEYVKQASEKVKFVTTVTKEMTDQGYISASTYAELVAKGDEYTACLEVVGGKLTVNVQKLKDLEKQEYQVIIAEKQLELAEWSAKEATSSTAKEIWEKCNALKEEIALYQQLSDDVDNAGVEEPKKDTDDPIKDAFQKRQKELEHLLNMEQITEAEYYKRLFDSKEYKALLANRTKYVDELNSIDEKFYKFKQDKYKEDADKQFDDLEDQRKRGIITAEQYAQGLHDLGQELYGKDSIYGGTEFAIKALEELDKKVKEVSDDIYSELKDDLSADGDRLLDDVLADADELSKKNIELFKNKGDLKTFKKNAEDIFKTVSASAKDALERGLITPERFKEIIDQYSQGLDNGIIQDIFDDGFDAIADKAKDNLDKMLITPDEYFKLLDEWGKKLNISEDVIKKLKETLSESDYLDAWDLENGFDSKKSADNFELRAKRIEYIYELAEQLYGKDGQDNVKAYNELIKQGLEDEQSLVEDYYDKEIEKLEKINDEEEKRQKAIELQMNLIKARQKLEDAKKQKNQLVFHNGTFEYMEDQEAVKSAQEDVLEAEKAILEQQVEDQKEALEERKKAVSEFFNKVEGDVSGALDRIEKFISGDTSVYEKAPDKKDKDNSSDKLANRANSVIDSIIDLSEPNAFEKLISLFGGKPTNNSMKSFMDSFAATLVGKQIVPSTLPSNITNNSSTTNNNAKTVNIGDIHLHLELTVKSLDDFVESKLQQFAQEVGDAFESEILRKMYSH